MYKTIRVGVTIGIFGGLLIGCEDAETPSEINHPLTGTYTLTEMTINVEATTLRDTNLVFVTSQNGVESLAIIAGTVILAESDIYTDTDAVPIGGTVSLRSDLSGTLSGSLPVNWGTGCAPSVLISGLSSDGTWSADTTSGIFNLDLVVDALDIDGSFTLSGNQLEVTYVAVSSNDERVISSVTYSNAEVLVNPACIPVSTITERVLKLTRN